jgi:L-2-hydroxyglutarate oxidase
MTTDVLIIGGGIVGLSTAFNLQQTHPDKSVLLLEKESTLGQHQTGHNSGVLHSGIYYKPGSLKAVNCREGKRRMEQFCEEYGVAFDLCGKVIVAVSEEEFPRLDNIYARGQANGVRCEMIDRNRLLELEPHCAGIRAIHVPEAGIVNYLQVCERLGEIVVGHGHQIVTGARVTSLRQQADAVVVQSTAGEFQAKQVVNCAGLYSDRVTRLSGEAPQCKIVPFRGEFFELHHDAQHLCRTLIYPVPDPSFPFLGVHFTRTIEGGVECGPNAVLALAREGYGKLDVNLADLFDSLTYGGFLRLAFKYWRTGAGEIWRSFSKRAFVRELQRLIPEIRTEHLFVAPSGVRAQAIRSDGTMVDDFVIRRSQRVVNVCNAPSPAATSSLNIGRLIVEALSNRA